MMSAPRSGTPVSRSGIACGGTWVIDRIKLVAGLPGRGMLGNIQSETMAGGGAPFNVLVDLARMGAPFPLSAFGVIGNDAGGAFLFDTCRQYGINTAGMVFSKTAPTAYTDVMTETGTGERIFYHYRGANTLFSPDHIPVASLTCRIFHLGYLLLLDTLDQPDRDCGTVAAQLLKLLQDEGIKTSIDLVSEESDRFQKIVPPALRYTDYLIINEIEAGRTTGIPVRKTDGLLDGVALIDAVAKLFTLGRMALVVVHMPEGAYLRTRDGRRLSQGALAVPPDFIKGTTGAGDAFAAGVLYGLHEGWQLEKALSLAICAATACLADATTTGGLLEVEKLLRLGKRFPRRPPPVTD